MRTITIHKLINVFDFKVFQILSQSAEFIYVLIHADDNCLKREADRIGYNMEFEMGSVDLLSLEPMDSNLRPLRFVNHTKPLSIIAKEKNLEPLYSCLYYDNSNIYIIKIF